MKKISQRLNQIEKNLNVHCSSSSLSNELPRHNNTNEFDRDYMNLLRYLCDEFNIFKNHTSIDMNAFQEKAHAWCSERGFTIAESTVLEIIPSLLEVNKQLDS